MADTAEHLRSVPLFRDLPQKTLNRLQRVAVERSFKAGDSIVNEGERGAGFFLITHGSVEVVRGDTRLNTLKDGDFFGEMALLNEFPRSATVRALTDTECLAMSRWDFVAELRANPDLAVEMLEVMSARLRELDQRLSE